MTSLVTAQAVGPVGQSHAADLSQVVLQSLLGVLDPEVGISIYELAMFEDIRIVDTKASIRLSLPGGRLHLADAISDGGASVLGGIDGITRVEISCAEMSAVGGTLGADLGAQEETRLPLSNPLWASRRSAKCDVRW